MSRQTKDVVEEECEFCGEGDMVSLPTNIRSGQFVDYMLRCQWCGLYEDGTEE